LVLANAVAQGESLSLAQAIASALETNVSEQGKIEERERRDRNE
jgi:hypothetical protein